MPRILSIGFLASLAMAQIQPLRQAPASVPETPAPAGTGFIEGTVSDAATQAPLSKAQVTITGGIAAPLTAVTGPDGHFAFRELAEGSYWLGASKTGYNPPQSLFGPEPAAGVVLGNGEEKKGVEIALLPDGEISGRVADEEGVPIRGCTVTAVQPGYEQNQRTLVSTAGSTGTNDKGEYRVNNLAPGHYYLFARCYAELPAAHPLLPRGDPRTPHETYAPQFHGGGLDPGMASRLTVVAGSPLRDVDFRMIRGPSLTLRGRLTAGDPEALAGGLSLMLFPSNPLTRGLLMSGSGVSPQNQTFQIQAVMPGAYLLLAFSNHGGRVCAAQRQLEVGTAQPDAVQLSLECGAELKGSVQFDSADHPPIENFLVNLAPLDVPLFMPQPRAEADKEGAFTFASVHPGKYRLTVGLPGYVKSVSLGGQPVSPDGFPILGAAGPLRVVIGSKLAEVQVQFAGAAAGHQLSAVIFPDDASRLGTGQERSGTAMGVGQIEFGGMPPGRYRVFATDCPNPGMIAQRPDWLAALASHSALVDVPEGGRVTTTVETIPREELLRALEW